MASYRLLTFRSETGPRAGVALGDSVHDAAEVLGDPGYGSVLAILSDWTRAGALLDRAAESARSGGRPLASLELLAPIPQPGAIYCAGANYRDHVDNMAKKLNIPPEPDPHEQGLNPWHFIKSSWCVVGPDVRVELDSQALDWEAELAVVIGKRARRIGLDEVFAHVAGYTCANDLSARDRISREKIPPNSPFKYDWIGQKNFDGACPLGPWIVPAAAIPDPQNLVIRTLVNDAVKQDSNTGKMLFTAAEQIAYLSQRITLHPGDVVLTGTPAGVGAETGQRLNRGDVVTIEIEKIGRLTTHIA